MHSGRRPRGYLLVTVTVFAVALAARLWSLHWSPLPSTLDGFQYVSFAAETMQTGSFPLDRFRADSVVFTTLLTAVGLITGDKPLMLAQPVVAITGAASCLTVMALTRRVAWRSGWPSNRTLLAAGIAGMGVALDGLYVRRSGITDEEALAFLLIPLVAIAVHRLLQRRQRSRWLAVVLPLLVLFPILHTFSSLVAGLTLTGVVGVVLAQLPSRRQIVSGLGLGSAFWVYVWAYYDVAAQAGLLVPYVDRVTSYPGLFLAWLIVLVIGAVWLQRTSARLQRVAIGGLLGLWFVLVGVNVGHSVFPGMQTTPPALTVLVVAFAVPVGLALVGLPAVSRDRTGSGSVVLALLLAPIVVVYFSLTASLTPEYFDTAIRGHTFVHIAVFVLAAVGVGVLLSRFGSGADSETQQGTSTQGQWLANDGGQTMRQGLAAALAGLVLLSAVVTLPVAFVHLDTLTAPSVTTETQFAAASFTAQHSTSPWATDDPLGRVAGHTYPTGANNSQRPVVEWGRGGPAPTCPALAQASWATAGIHLFPAPAERLSQSALAQWRTQNDVVYSARGGVHSVFLVVPSPAHNSTAC